MITSIQLQSFKGHRDTTVPLGRLTVLVGPNGTGKTSVLQALSLMARLMTDEPGKVLRGDMRLPDLLRRTEQEPITLTTQPSLNRVGNKVFIDFHGAPDVPAHGASEGTLITLALLTALCSPNRPRLLLLDDIDQSLHPQAQMELMGELKRLLEGFPEVQLVATTHSPYILDALEPSDVRVFAPRKDGSVACRSLSEHPQAEKMRGALTAGQLWSLDPEWRWVVGER